MEHHFSRFLVIAALAAGTSFGQSTPVPTPAPAPAPATPAHPRAAIRQRIRQRLMTALNLSDTQKQQAKTIFQQARQSALPVVQQMRQNRQAMAAAVKANDTATIHSLANQQGNLQGQVLAIRSESMAKFYATLTPAQKTKADAIRQKIQQRLQQRQAKAATNG